jgi:peroxiredoxin
MRKLFILSLLLFSAMVASGCQTSTGGANAPIVGNPAPDFQLQDTDGNTVSLSALKGSPVIINFWRISCTYCVGEFPYLQEIYQKNSPPLVLLAINIRDAATKVADVLTNNNLSFPALLDSAGNVAVDYGVSGIPVTFFVDKDGIIQAVRLGAFNSSAQIEGYLDKIMP